MSKMTSENKKELIKLSPMLLYEIAMDIQVTGKWMQFASLVGFTAEQTAMLQINSGDRFPAENVMYHWFSKNPRTENLAEHLCTMLLDKPLTRLRNNLEPSTYQRLMEKLRKNRDSYTKQLSKENTDCCVESIPDDREKEIYNQPHAIQSQMSNVSVNSTSDSTVPEPGIVSISMHDPSIPRSLAANVSEKKHNVDKNDEISSNEDKTYTMIKTMLKEKSTEFFPDEFIEIDTFGRSLQGNFSSHFPIKVRANQFYVRAFFLPRILKITKEKKRLYNIIWSLENFRLNHFPTLTGFCFYDNYLFLLFPLQRWHTLYDILHRPHDAENKTISGLDRLNIVERVGEALAFLHNSLPFSGYHGQVSSHNVLVSNTNVILTGFDKFCTQKPEYLKGLEIIKKPNIDFEECFRKDKIQYLELICEIWWNVQPSNLGENHFQSPLIKDVASKIILNPKIKYEDWSYELNENIRKIIIRYSEDSKESGSIAEIVADLSEDVHEPYPSLEPPSYDECTELFCELKQDIEEVED